MSVYKQCKLKDLNYDSLLLWNKDLLKSVNLEIKVITENDANPVIENIASMDSNNEEVTYKKTRCRNDQIYILFYKNSNLIGHASYSEVVDFDHPTKNELELESLYIEEEYRSKGIGSLLLKIFDKYFESVGINSIGGVVLSPRARVFYAKNGYTILPRGTDYTFIKEYYIFIKELR